MSRKIKWCSGGGGLWPSLALLNGARPWRYVTLCWWSKYKGLQSTECRCCRGACWSSNTSFSASTFICRGVNLQPGSITSQTLMVDSSPSDHQSTGLSTFPCTVILQDQAVFAHLTLPPNAPLAGPHTTIRHSTFADPPVAPGTSRTWNCLFCSTEVRNHPTDRVPEKSPDVKEIWIQLETKSQMFS